MIEKINDFLETEEETVDQLKKFMKDFSHMNSMAYREDQVYLGHPIDVYLLIRRMAVEWTEIMDSLKESADTLRDIQIQNKGVDLQMQFLPHLQAINPIPKSITDEEMNDAIRGVVDLINIYKLDVKSLANGIIRYNDSTGEEIVFDRNDTNIVLNAYDCYFIGKQMYDNNDYPKAMQWFEESIGKVDDYEATDEDRAEVFLYMAYCAAKMSKNQLAQTYAKMSFAIFPERKNDKILDELKMISSEDKSGTFVVSELENQFTKQLCRGVKLLNDTIQSRLRCYHLNTNQIPFLRLTHIKVEEMHQKPHIVVIHQFLSDYEVDVMKALAVPRLHRSTTVNQDTKQSQTDRYRVAEGSWLKDWDNQVIETITQRITAITGMDIKAAEEYNAIKYGIGGFYAPHWDVFVPTGTQLHERIYGDALNRVATWINYLNNVESGGATIFPHLNVTVWPEKGSAVLWFNLYKSGIVDLNTLHGGCPVLMGTKWIATKWIPEAGQMFTKPCSPNIDEYNRL